MRIRREDGQGARNERAAASLLALCLGVLRGSIRLRFLHVRVLLRLEGSSFLALRHRLGPRSQRPPWMRYGGSMSRVLFGLLRCLLLAVSLLRRRLGRSPVLVASFSLSAGFLSASACSPPRGVGTRHRWRPKGATAADPLLQAALRLRTMPLRSAPLRMREAHRRRARSSMRAPERDDRNRGEPPLASLAARRSRWRSLAPTTPANTVVGEGDACGRSRPGAHPCPAVIGRRIRSPPQASQHRQETPLVTAAYSASHLAVSDLRPGRRNQVAEILHRDVPSAGEAHPRRGGDACADCLRAAEPLSVSCAAAPAKPFTPSSSQTRSITSWR